MVTSTSETTAVTVLKQHNLKVTPQRKEVLAYLIGHHNHPTAEMISQSLAKKAANIGAATIYNTLKTFVELGFVVEIQNGDSSKHYDYFHEPHLHVICTNCGRIDDVFSPNYQEIEQQLFKETQEHAGYITSGSMLEISGICPACQKKLHLHLIK